MNVVEALRLPGIEEALGRVEESLAASTAGEDPFLAEVAVHLVQAGGKRLRPALVLAAASACGAGPEVPSGRPDRTRFCSWRHALYRMCDPNRRAID